MKNLMRTLLALLFLSWNSQNLLFSQTAEVDSLRKELSKNLHDTTRLKTLADLSKKLMTVNPQEGVTIGEELVVLSRTLERPKTEVDGLVNLGQCYLKTGQPEKAKLLAQEALAKDRINGGGSIGRVCNFLGSIAYTNGDLDSAMFYFKQMLNDPNIDRRLTGYLNLGLVGSVTGVELDTVEMYYQKALALSEESRDSADIGSSLSALGTLEMRRENIEKAMEYFSEGYRIYETLMDQEGMITNLLNISMIFLQKQDESESRFYLKKAIGIAEESGIVSNVVLLCYTELAGLLAQNKEYKESISLSEKAVALAQQMGSKSWEASGLAYIAIAHRESGELDKALDFALRAEQLSPYIESYDHFTVVYICLAKTWLAKKEPQKAIPYFNTLDSLSEEIDRLALKSISTIGLYQSHELLGDWQKAFHYLKEAKTASDSIVMQANTNALNKVKTEFQTEQRIKENEVLQTTNTLITQQRNQLMIGATILAALLAGLVYFYFQMRKARNLIKTQNDQLESLNRTKDRLFAIISHDLRSEISAFSSLGKIIDFYLKTGKTDRLRPLIEQVNHSSRNLNNLMDNLLTWSVNQLEGVPLSPETLDMQSQSKTVLELFELHAKAKGITLKNEIENELKVLADENSLQLILRNLVGNAVKFTPEGGEIILRSAKNAGKISIEIQDTGIGIPDEKLAELFEINRKGSSEGTAGERGTGLGLALCKEFVERNGGEIYIQSEMAQGTLCRFTLPSAN